MRRPSSNGRARVRVWARAGTSRGAREYSYSCAYSHCPPHAYGVDAAFGVRFSSPVRPRASRSRFSLSSGVRKSPARRASTTASRSSPSSSSSASSSLLRHSSAAASFHRRPAPRRAARARRCARVRLAPAAVFRRGAAPASALADLRGVPSARRASPGLRVGVGERPERAHPPPRALVALAVVPALERGLTQRAVPRASRRPGLHARRAERVRAPGQRDHAIALVLAAADVAPRRAVPREAPGGTARGGEGREVGDGNGRPRPDAPWPGASSRGSSPSRGVERSHHAPGVVPTLGRRCRGRFGARDATASSTAAAEGAPRGARPIRGSRATPTRGSSPRASSRGVPAGEVTERARDDSHGLKSHATKCMAPAPRGVIIVVFLLASSTRQQPKPRRRRRASSRRPRLPPRVVPRLAAMRASPARACFSCPPSGPAPRPARSTPRRPSRVVRPDSPRVASRPRDAGAPRAGDDDDAPRRREGGRLGCAPLPRRLSRFAAIALAETRPPPPALRRARAG